MLTKLLSISYANFIGMNMMFWAKHFRKLQNGKNK